MLLWERRWENKREYIQFSLLFTFEFLSMLSVRLLCRTATERLMLISGKAYRLVIDKLSLLFVAFLAPFMLLRC